MTCTNKNAINISTAINIAAYLAKNPSNIASPPISSTNANKYPKNIGAGNPKLPINWAVPSNPGPPNAQKTFWAPCIINTIPKASLKGKAE